MSEVKDVQDSPQQVDIAKELKYDVAKLHKLFYYVH